MSSRLVPGITLWSRSPHCVSTCALLWKPKFKGRDYLIYLIILKIEIDIFYHIIKKPYDSIYKVKDLSSKLLNKMEQRKIERIYLLFCFQFQLLNGLVDTITNHGTHCIIFCKDFQQITFIIENVSTLITTFSHTIISLIKLYKWCVDQLSKLRWLYIQSSNWSDIIFLSPGITGYCLAKPAAKLRVVTWPSRHVAQSSRGPVVTWPSRHVTQSSRDLR